MQASQTIVVRGRYPFPWDMLRHDQAAPYDSYEVRKLEELANVCPGEVGRERMRKVYLIKLNVYVQGGATVGRWQSFRWGCWDVNDRSAPREGD